MTSISTFNQLFLAANPDFAKKIKKSTMQLIRRCM